MKKTNLYYYELYLDYKDVISQITDFDICLSNKSLLKISSPIINFNNLNFSLYLYFKEQGEYDIFDRKNKFYNDIWSPAKLENNDIILSNRLIDIYPSNISYCPLNCKYNGIDIENKRINCNCKVKYSDNYEINLIDNKEIIKFFKDPKNLVNHPKIWLIIKY